MPAVKFDAQCNEACRNNNAAVIEKNEDQPTLGGNVAKYTELSGQDKSAGCSEFTMVKFTGTTGEQFIALQLALDFEGMNEGSKDKLAPADPSKAPESDIAAAGEAAASTNAMDAGNQPVAQPNGMDTDPVAQPNSMGDAEESKATTAAAPKEAAKPAATDNKKKTTDKKTAAATKPGYSPVLDEELTMIGCSNKAHKKTTNVIQVLYVKNAVNAMV